MESGADNFREEHQSEEATMNGSSLEIENSVSADIQAEQDQPRDIEENKVFEEAMDNNRFYTTNYHRQSDGYHISSFGKEDDGKDQDKDNRVLETDKSSEVVDGKISDLITEEQVFPTSNEKDSREHLELRLQDKGVLEADKSDELGEADVCHRGTEEGQASEAEKFHTSLGVQVNGNSPQEPAGQSPRKLNLSTYCKRSNAALDEDHHSEMLYESLVTNEGSEGVEQDGSEEPHEFTDGQVEVVDQSSDVVGVCLEEKAEDLNGSNGELKGTDDKVVKADPNYIENAGKIDNTFEVVKEGLEGENDTENNEKVVVEGKHENKFNELNMDGSGGVLHLQTLNADSAQVVAEEKDSNGVAEFHQGVPEENCVETVSPMQGQTYMSSGNGRSSGAEIGGTYSQFASGVEQIKSHERESLLVEDDDVSSSSDRDEAHPDPVPQQPTSGAGSSGGPSMPARPAGLGSSAPLLKPSSRLLQQARANGSISQNQPQPVEEPATDEPEENKETREKLQMIRVKFLRLAHRLGQTPHNVVVAQVLYRLGLAEQLWGNTNRAGVFSFDRATIVAEQLEAAGQDPLDFTCTIMVIGKSGVGKSATINSIFDEGKLRTDAFKLGTKKVQDIVGTVQGIKVRVIDTPGLSPSSSDRSENEKILRSVKKFINKTPPDIVLYFDRLDMQSRDFGDVSLLRTITDTFGASIWFNAIVVLTHAASAPPEGPHGTLSYEMFVTQRTHVVQQAIRQAAGDLRLMNPVSLVENHSACRINNAGQRVLPNGQVWRPQLLLLSFASKILAEANQLLKLQDSPPGRSFGRLRVPPLPFLLSSLLQSRPQLKLPDEQIDDEDTLEDYIDEASDSDGVTEEYDELPPFKRLTKSQLAKLSRVQKKAYFEELEYREKLFYRKQLKEEKIRREMLKKMAEAAKDLPSDHKDEGLEEESSSPASVPVPMPDMVLPASFDSDSPSHRYRFLDSTSQWLVRPVLETQGWDHDVGYEGLNVERLFVVKDKIPVSVSGQLTKDKKDCSLQMELGTALKHSEEITTSLGLDVQSVGKELAYTLHGETRCKNFKRNNTTAGVSVNLLGDAVSTGIKIEDKLVVSRRLRLLMSAGAMSGRGDVAYGGRLEATIRDKDFPLGRALSTLALSIVDWHGDLAIGCNIQSQIPLGRATNLIGHANVSNRGSGQVGIRLNSSEHIQLALLAIVPILGNLKRMLAGSRQQT